MHHLIKLLLFIWYAEDANIVLKFNGDVPKSFFKKIGCEGIRTIDSKYICIQNEKLISVKDTLTIGRNYPNIHSIYEDIGEKRVTRFFLNDPDIYKQSIYSGFLPNSEFIDGQGGYTHDLYKLWEIGINGTGIIVAIVDDGVSVHHQDLRDNFDPKASYNFIENIRNPDTITEKHGTKCAGLISGVANNNICGVGSAFGSKFGALRIMSASVGDIRDSDEAMAFSFMPNYIRIMSMSWGPMDDGEKIGRPNELSSKALYKGAFYGFNGLGTIYIFSAGNGGRNSDFCGFDGYLQMYEVFVIGSMSTRGTMPPYGERCTAIIASTLSNEFNFEGRIYTTEPINQCGNFHSGTSVSSPIAASIIALTLQNYPNLTRRDIQDLIVRTSIQVDPYAFTNGMGLRFSLNFGFGLLNAHKMVENAKNFTSLSTLKICKSPLYNIDCSVKYGGSIHSYIYLSGCYGTNYNITQLEVVMITITLEIDSRNALKLFLTSPSGTRYPILEQRHLDKSPDGLYNWNIKIMGYYDENPYGMWHLEMSAEYGHKAKLVSWKITLYGTSKDDLLYSSTFTSFRQQACSKQSINIHHSLSNWCNINVKNAHRYIGEDQYAFLDNEKILMRILVKKNEPYNSFIFGSTIVFLVCAVIIIYFICSINSPNQYLQDTLKLI